MSFGLDRPKPPAFYLPAAYLAHTVYFEDVRTFSDGTLWLNETDWKPATRRQSPIELFSFPAACRADNVLIPSDSRGYEPKPSSSLDGAHSTQIPSDSRGFEPKPSTSSAGASSTQLPKATKIKSKPKRKSEPAPRKPEPAPRKRTKAA